MAKLEAAEKRCEFYTGLDRQYSFDLLKLCIYVRKLTANERIRAYLEAKAADVLGRFDRRRADRGGPLPGQMQCAFARPKPTG